MHVFLFRTQIPFNYVLDDEKPTNTAVLRFETRLLLMRCILLRPQVQLYFWTSKEIAQHSGRFDEMVIMSREGTMRHQLQAEASKYDFLMHVHPALGAADVMDVDWPFYLKNVYVALFYLTSICRLRH